MKCECFNVYCTVMTLAWKACFCEVDYDWYDAQGAARKFYSYVQCTTLLARTQHFCIFPRYCEKVLLGIKFYH